MKQKAKKKGSNPFFMAFFLTLLIAVVITAFSLIICRAEALLTGEQVEAFSATLQEEAGQYSYNVFSNSGTVDLTNEIETLRQLAGWKKVLPVKYQFFFEFIEIAIDETAKLIDALFS